MTTVTTLDLTCEFCGGHGYYEYCCRHISRCDCVTEVHCDDCDGEGTRPVECTCCERPIPREGGYAFDDVQVCGEACLFEALHGRRGADEISGAPAVVVDALRALGRKVA